MAKRSTRPWLLAGGFLALGLISAPVSASVIASSPNLPPFGAQYDGGGDTVFNTAQGVFVLSDLRFFGFTAQTPPPLNVSDPPVQSLFSATVQGGMSVNGGALIPFTGFADIAIEIFKTVGQDGSAIGEFATEIVALSLVGLPGGALLQESPTKPSTGKTKIESAGGGFFRIDSFFDIFFELQIEGGVPPPPERPWVPSVDPRFVKLTTPEPSALVLLALGLLGIARYARRRS